MTIDCKVDVVQSLFVHLLFDDQSTKNRLVSVNDLIDVVWNGNGARKHMIGRVARISAVGSDPHSWYMIVDGADDFKSLKERICPVSILDLEIIRKASDETLVHTVKGDNCCPYIRIVKGRLQYSIDGFNWLPVKINDKDIIEDQEGTVPVEPVPPLRPGIDDYDNADGIEDAVW